LNKKYSVPPHEEENVLHFKPPQPQKKPNPYARGNDAEYKEHIEGLKAKKTEIKVPLSEFEDEYDRIYNVVSPVVSPYRSPSDRIHTTVSLGQQDRSARSPSIHIVSPDKSPNNRGYDSKYTPKPPQDPRSSRSTRPDIKGRTTRPSSRRGGRRTKRRKHKNKKN
jgi:hypothetical protein